MILKVPLFREGFLLCGLVMFLALADSVCDDQIVFRADPEEVHCLSCASLLSFSTLAFKLLAIISLSVQGTLRKTSQIFVEFLLSLFGVSHF